MILVGEGGGIGSETKKLTYYKCHKHRGDIFI